ncbi:MAG TPA: cyclopropane fatty acyl phospholipid synthase [Myxococcales bacterium]|nr:cyclopropane fatty acyl phospholipid synthase [Myxococcales bacterium]
MAEAGTHQAATLSSAQRRITAIFAAADIRMNGERAWDVRVHDDRFYRRVLLQGALGLGESYMDGDWDCGALDQLFDRALRGRLQESVVTVANAWEAAKELVLNRQSRRHAREGVQHYEIGNDLYQRMLDRRMLYTCAYWQWGAKDVDQAQEAKLELVCRKLGLKPGMRVLDLGCGWAGFSRYAAEKYGVSAVALTLSKEQAELGSELCRGLPVTVELADYREAEGVFDRVVAIGLLEHVGPKNYRSFMRTAARCLDPSGLALFHTIGSPRSSNAVNAWTDKYIFPNAVIPSIKQLASAMEGLFVVEDWHNFGADYDPTLMAWNDRFEAAWPELQATYGERFRRMWRYYLLQSAGAFRARYMQLWQMVVSPRGVPGGYTAVR